MQNTFATYTVPAATGWPGAGVQPTTYPQPRRSAWNIVVLLSLFLLPVSLIPSTWVTFYHFPLLPYVWWTENAVLIFAFIVLAAKFMTG